MRTVAYLISMQRVAPPGYQSNPKWKRDDVLEDQILEIPIVIEERKRDSACSSNPSFEIFQTIQLYNCLEYYSKMKMLKSVKSVNPGSF